MLTQRYTREQIADTLVAPLAWHPYPSADQRDAWLTLPDPIRTGTIAEAERNLDYRWPSLPATLFLGYVREGNRSEYQAARTERREVLHWLTMAECMEHEGRFLDQILNGIWQLCEESYWGVPSHLHLQKAGHGLPDTAEPTVDLFAAETGMQLAWTLYLLRPQLDSISPLIAERIEREIRLRILDPLLEREDFRWMGFNNTGRRVNNWNPWIVSNWIICNLLIERDRTRQVDATMKAMRTLDHFIDPYPRDGGCDEGPGYWGRAGASMFECLDMLRDATGGLVDVFDEPLIGEMGRFVYRAHIAEDYYVNFADAPATTRPDAAIIYEYGERIGDRAMMEFGGWLAHQADLFGLTETRYGSTPPSSMGRVLRTTFLLDPLRQVRAAPPLPRDTWLPDIEVMIARDHDGSADGFFTAAKGGTNDESHNHNDIGQFIVYLDGQPLIVDAGVEIYNAKTFSARRYEIWTMRSTYHNLPTINGVEQSPGPDFKARVIDYSADDTRATFSLDIAGAYPPEARLTGWERTVTLVRGDSVTVEDRYVLAEAVPEITLSLLTAGAVTLGVGQIEIAAKGLAGDRVSAAGVVEYDAAKLTPTVETIAIEDLRLGATWGSDLTRIIFTAQNPPQTDTWAFTIRRG